VHEYFENKWSHVRAIMFPNCFVSVALLNDKMLPAFDFVFPLVKSEIHFGALMFRDGQLFVRNRCIKLKGNVRATQPQG